MLWPVSLLFYAIVILSEGTMNPFDIVKSVTTTKEVVITEENEKDYNPWMVNKALSYYEDCIAFAQLMNENYNLDKKLQYDFLLNIVTKRKRPFAKWEKVDKEADLDAIIEYYNVSPKKAREILDVIGDEKVVIIRQKLEKGGKNRG